jgi:Family of unknown function (DUF6502)
MSEGLKHAVQRAVLRLLDPLVKLLLEAGIGVGDLLNLIKIAYVKAAREQGREAGDDIQRPNASRIAVVTGLTRGEVAEILASDGAGAELSERGRQRAERVLSGWWNDPDFQTETGQPRALPVQGKRGSFAVLCHRYSGERRTAPVLDELLRVKAVRTLANGQVEALSRTYATVRWDPTGITAAGEQLREHCGSLLHNLRNPSRPRFVRRVINTRLDATYAPMLVRDIEQQASSFADTLDDALNDPQHTASSTRRGLPSIQLGVLVCVVEEPVEPDTPLGRQPANKTESSPRRGRGTLRRKRKGTPPT